MPTVVARFEPSKRGTNLGTIYYRIYKGHNRRMEFSSHIHLPMNYWDEVSRTVKETASNAHALRGQIKTDLALLNQIIAEDTNDLLTMRDMIRRFKKRKEELSTIIQLYYVKN